MHLSKLANSMVVEVNMTWKLNFFVNRLHEEFSKKW